MPSDYERVRAWRIVREQMKDMGDGELHGDDHHDGECPLCVAIVDLDRKFNFIPTT